MPVGAWALALAYGGIAQFAAGIWEFRTGNTFGAVAFCSYGAFWISFFFLVQLDIAKIPGGEVNSALGLYLWTWGIFTAYMFIASLRTTGAVALVFLLLAITFIVLGIGNCAAGKSPTARSSSAATSGSPRRSPPGTRRSPAVINSTFGRIVAPVFPLNALNR